MTVRKGRGYWVWGVRMEKKIEKSESWIKVAWKFAESVDDGLILSFPKKSHINSHQFIFPKGCQGIRLVA